MLLATLGFQMQYILHSTYKIIKYAILESCDTHLVNGRVTGDVLEKAEECLQCLSVFIWHEQHDCLEGLQTQLAGDVCRGVGGGSCDVM